MKTTAAQTVYYGGVIAGGVIGLLAVLGVVDPAVAAPIAAMITALTGGTAAARLNRQLKDGTLEFSGSAPDQAVAAIQATISQAQTAQADAARVADAVTGALSALPVVGPAVGSAAGSLIGQVIARAAR